MGLFLIPGVIYKLLFVMDRRADKTNLTDVFSFQESIFDHVLFPQSLLDICVCVFAYVWVRECTVYSIYSMCVCIHVHENVGM